MEKRKIRDNYKIKKRASIIIPAYNVEKFISNTLKSTLEQTMPHQEYEVIVVNDGSTDKTAEKVHSFLNNKTIKYVEQENKGVSIARNTGIENAESDFFLLLDADDLFVPDTVKSCVDFIEDNRNIGLTYSQHIRIDEYGKFIKSYSGFDFDKEDLFHFNFVSPVKTFRREVYEQIGGFDSNSYCEDYDFALRAATENFNFGRIPQTLYRYIIHKGGRSLVEEKLIKSGEEAITRALSRVGRSNLKGKYIGKVPELENHHYYAHVPKEDEKS